MAAGYGRCAGNKRAKPVHYSTVVSHPLEFIACGELKLYIKNRATNCF